MACMGKTTQESEEKACGLQHRETLTEYMDAYFTSEHTNLSKSPQPNLHC